MKITQSKAKLGVGVALLTLALIAPAVLIVGASHPPGSYTFLDSDERAETLHADAIQWGADYHITTGKQGCGTSKPFCDDFQPGVFARRDEAMAFLHRYHLVLCGDVDPSDCVLQGEPGEPGKNGEDGEPGIDGVDGVDGEDGKDGVDGKDGDTGKDGDDGKEGPSHDGDGHDGGDDGHEAASAEEGAVAGGFHWAVVNHDGSVRRSSESASSAQVATGVYEVGLDSAGDITACSYTANVDHEGAGGHGTLDVGAGSGSTVVVHTFDDSGAAASLAFQLQVMC